MSLYVAIARLAESAGTTNLRDSNTSVPNPQELIYIDYIVVLEWLSLPQVDT